MLPNIYVIRQGEFREENFQKAMAVIREGGTDPGSLKGRKGGTKGTHKDLISRVCYISLVNLYRIKQNKKMDVVFDRQVYFTY